ncbi:hypothetical protein [Plantibacter sp. YIM 135249]|uniref:hypothetical protein n=1 Tax=Plantibacter sp. YIM 135249 TaxID=3423918 RepID=UPI003D344B7C
MTIKLDPSPSQTVVILCTECDFWSAVRFGYEEAHRCAADHERQQHPGVTQARDAAAKYRSRHADDSSIVRG